MVARSYEEAADITKSIIIFRWRDDAALQAASSRVGKIAERMGEVVPGLAPVDGEDYELVIDL
jgi:hypothetical protein